MHISEGVLPAGVLLTGAALSAGGLYLGLRGLRDEEVPKAGLLSGAFFVASLVHVPAGPFSVHLLLNGLVGLMLGWVAFPAILVALVLQAVLFQFGGVTTLGVNLFVMAAPGVLCYYLYRPLLKGRAWPLAGILTGITGVLGGAFLLSWALYLSGQGFRTAAKLTFLSQLPVAVIECVITTFVIGFLKKLKPQLLEEA